MHFGSICMSVWTRDSKTIVPIADTPQFRGGNRYFFSENLYQSVSFIYASRKGSRDSYREAVCKTNRDIV